MGLEGNTSVPVEDKMKILTSARALIPISNVVSPTAVNIVDTQRTDTVIIDLSHLLKADRIVRKIYSLQTTVKISSVLETSVNIALENTQ